VHADTIHTLTHGWATVLDRDETRPTEGDVDQRYLWLGREQHGLVPIRGKITTEVAAMIGQVFNATLSPRTKPRNGTDRSTPVPIPHHSISDTGEDGQMAKV